MQLYILGLFIIAFPILVVLGAFIAVLLGEFTGGWFMPYQHFVDEQDREKDNLAREKRSGRTLSVFAIVLAIVSILALIYLIVR